ncbi:hypothetical protein [Legionella septentrionalis]|uniref:Dot/Icm secretion system substrate n=1 Tax=Legionella septentrionalis TaxID=2498109 RepID=A0A3S0V9B6_9GAMM|nr:hypothetical protein [Legionella septentrionalis]RUQ78856.1 hypothetical protein EKM59_11565 [Legionella septentrionalis]
MPIGVFSLDFDGCLFHQDFCTSGNKNVIHHNIPFLRDHLLELKKTFSKTIAFVGSNRQSYTIDIGNAWGKGSCFPALEKICIFLGLDLDTFLLADIYGNLPAGTSFNRAIEAYVEAYEGEHADWLFDETKVSILYAQMHKIAQENPNEDIRFHFYDDKDSILKSVSEFFTQYPELMPKNVSLIISKYAGDVQALQQIATITGCGIIDNDYRATVKKMGYLANGEQEFKQDKIYVADKFTPQQHQRTEFKQQIDHANKNVPLLPQSKYLAYQKAKENFEQHFVILEDKIKDLQQRNELKAVHAAETLLKNLKEAYNQHILNGGCAASEFKKDCNLALDHASAELSKHRGWGEFLGNLALAICSFGLLVIVKGVVNVRQNRNFFFLYHTDSAKKLHAIQETANADGFNLLQSTGLPCQPA